MATVKISAQLGTPFQRQNQDDTRNINRLHQALKFVLFSQDDGGVCPIPGYFNNPENPFAKNYLPEPDEATALEWRSPDRYLLVLEAISTFMRQAEFSPEIQSEFDHFLLAYGFFLEGFPQDLFKPPAWINPVDSPARWTVKCWIAIAVEAYVRDGIKSRTAASRFIANCFATNNQKRKSVQSVVCSISGKATTKSFAGVIEDWNRQGRQRKIPIQGPQQLFDKQAGFLDQLKQRAKELSSDKRAGDVVIGIAIRSLRDNKLADTPDAIRWHESYASKAATLWSEFSGQ